MTEIFEGMPERIDEQQPALNAFAITFEGRLHPTNTN